MSCGRKKGKIKGKAREGLIPSLALELILNCLCERGTNLSDLAADSRLCDGEICSNLLLTAILDNHSDDLESVRILHALQRRDNFTQCFVHHEAFLSRSII